VFRGYGDSRISRRRAPRARAVVERKILWRLLEEGGSSAAFTRPGVALDRFFASDPYCVDQVDTCTEAAVAIERIFDLH
jgi:hypothetical protein